LADVNEMDQLEDLCQAVPPLGPERLAAARAKIMSAITEDGIPPRGARLFRLAIPTKLGRRWLGWVTPLAAAAAVAAVIVGTHTIIVAIHGHGTAPRARPVIPAIAYVAVNAGHGVVVPIRTATNRALPPIPAGHDPIAVAITPDGDTAYVVNQNNPGSVTPIRTATGTALPQIKVGQDPIAIVITPDGKTAYVANESPGSVTPISTATNTALPAITTGLHPVGLAITPNGKTVYVVNTSSNSVTPIDTATNRALAPVPVGHNPFGIAITPNGRTA
jgi:YVTN family beta-propeller protein